MIRRLLNTLFVGILIASVISLVIPVQAESPSNVFPDLDDMPSALSVVADKGDQFGLNATVSNYKVFTTNGGKIRVIFRDFCKSRPGWGTGIIAEARLYRHDASENITPDPAPPGPPNPPPIASGTSSACNYNLGQDLRLEIGSLVKSNVPGHTDFFTFRVEVSIMTGTSIGGIKGYRIEIDPFGYVSFVEDTNPMASTYPTTTAFAVLDEDFIGSQRDEENYYFRFAPNCSITTDHSVYLKWSDADYGRSNEQNGIGWRLIDETIPSSPVTIATRTNAELMIEQSGSGIPGSGNDVKGNYRVPLKAFHRYLWQWFEVDHQNGVQLWIPYSEVNSQQNCGTWDYTPNISSTSPAVVLPGDKIKINGSSTNTGTLKGQPTNLRIRIKSESFNDMVTVSNAHGGEVTASGNYVDHSLSALNPSSTSAVKSATFTVSSSADSGDVVCFDVGVKPFQGYNAVITSTGYRRSTTSCYSVATENWQYNGNVISPPRNVTSGETIDVIGDVLNSGGGTGVANYTVQIYPSLNGDLVTTGSIGAGGTWTGTNNQFAQWSETQAITAGNNSTDRDAAYAVDSDAPEGSSICFNVRVMPSAGKSSPTLTITNNGWGIGSERCFTVKNPERPYLEISGADVWAGAVLADQENWYSKSACSAGTASGGDTKIHSVVSSSPLRGSFTTFGAFATGDITSFGSQGVPTSKTLSFANTGALPGDFSNEGLCLTNFYRLFDNEPETLPAHPNYLAQNGQFLLNGNLVIGSSTIAPGQKLLLLVNGNITINNNITYANYSVADRDQIPFLMLVATGTININHQVSTLDGIYVAHGNINTCSNKPQQITQGSVCDNKLTINGAFIANKINFDRSAGGLLRGGSAEQFVFSPESFLGAPDFITSYFGGFMTQQFKDLPPVY